MPRPTVKVKLKCFRCKSNFTILRWENNNKLKRNTKKHFCSAKCKHENQKIGGETSPSWKGGRRIFPSRGGYVYINIAPNKRMAEHRFVMEKHLGRKLKKGEVVHHLNENPSDNRIENLVVCESAGQHIAKYHTLKRKKGKFIRGARLVAEEKVRKLCQKRNPK